MGFNLKQQLVFYGAYHNEPTNVAIHMACVPLLLATGQILLTNTPALRTPTMLLRLNLPLNVATLASLIYSTLYLVLSPNIAGATISPLVLGGAAFANSLATKYDRTKANTIAAGVHIVSWILQFIGHGKFERRKPALLDNLVQALFLAPLFVWYETLFKLGLYKRLKKEVDSAIEVELRKLRAKKGE
ncbi:DUF962-domain-containing protein [Karstenula rhodostoma CBS 690.94]|uniref:DUF962-domain-containing protein n=1 Tax=Karstenula rhodostoma CBS 690.94 TaxID=1392251 RepID=A0A9P4PR43_9PLEO|nr:DUF962-domain-containing protein [Karstenula rhodostoma CBS 690.94]